MRPSIRQLIRLYLSRRKGKFLEPRRRSTLERTNNVTIQVSAVHARVIGFAVISKFAYSSSRMRNRRRRRI